jgi:hypothetical protein
VAVVKAEDPFAYIGESYMYLSVEAKKVNLGSILAHDLTVTEALTIKVISNCLHGPVMVAMQDSLKNRYGNEIKLDRVFVRSEDTDGFISMEKPVVISEADFGQHDIVLDFKVEAAFMNDKTGRYKGTLAFTILPAP